MRWKRTARKMFIIIGITILLIELMLRRVDPVGVFMRYEDARQFTLNNIRVDHPTRGFTYQPGSYNLYTYDLTITDNNERLVPAAGSGNCTIRFVGDSITMGLGVEDEEAFANLIGMEYPDVTIHNNGISGYNIQQVATVIEETEADGYVYFIFSNDAEVTEPDESSTLPLWMISAIGMHIHHNISIPRQAATVENDLEMFSDIYQSLVEREDTITFAFEGIPLPVNDATVLLPAGYAWLSPTDPHPSPFGHLQIAEAMKPHIADFFDLICNENQGTA